MSTELQNQLAALGQNPETALTNMVDLITTNFPDTPAQKGRSKGNTFKEFQLNDMTAKIYYNDGKAYHANVEDRTIPFGVQAYCDPHFVRPGVNFFNYTRNIQPPTG